MEALGGIKVVAAYGAEDIASSRYEVALAPTQTIVPRVAALTGVAGGLLSSCIFLTYRRGEEEGRGSSVVHAPPFFPVMGIFLNAG